MERTFYAIEIGLKTAESAVMCLERLLGNFSGITA